MEFNMREQGMNVQFEFGELQISGKEEYGFRPFQLMIASITSCSAMVFRKILKKQRVTIEDLTVTAEVKRNANEANRIEYIHLTFIVKGKELNVDRLNKSLSVARKNCAMIRSVENCIQIEETLQVLDS